MERPAGTSAVVLISMPWNALGRPPLALGILKSVLAQHGVAATVRSFDLTFAEHMVGRTAADPRPVTLDDYTMVADESPTRGFGDWVFAVEPFRRNTPEADAAYFATMQLAPARAALLERVRGLVPEFLAACVDDVLALRPSVVGFTTTFTQSVSSLVLARLLKERAPELTVVFGGAACEGPMGAALHASFPWVDCVVRGEGEVVFPTLVRDILAGAPPSEQPGLCFRRGETQVVCAEAAPDVVMDDVPLPDFDEYFAHVEASPIQASLATHVVLSYESARGCWWGAKHHCTFCGLNGSSMKFRSKSPARVVDDIRRLAERYQVLDFFVVDNIIDMKYFGSVLPELARSGWDLRIFFETKANLRLDQIRELYLAGVTAIQPGIESLSTPILKLMRKGVTALQNIRLLKWCAAHRIAVTWNIIYGIPGEPMEEYPRMVELCRALGHLAPPSLSHLRIDRFSPYFETPDAFGLRVTRPLKYYAHIYDVAPATLFDLAYFFAAEHTDGRDPAVHTAPLVAAIERWNANSSRSYRSLRYRRGPGFVVIDDHRPGLGPRRFELDELEAAIYLACDAGESAAAVRERVAAIDPDLGVDEIREFLDDMVAAGLMYREADRYLSLALPEHPDELLRHEARGAQSPRSAAPRLVVVP